MVDLAAEPLTKPAGEPKEAHTAALDMALPVFDVHAYVEEFGAGVMPAYKSGTADRGYAADNGLARSIIPPGTAATRDFSTLAPRIPELIAEACVGCMACVSACPDTAILATAQPRAALEQRITDFAATQPDAAAVAADLHKQFATTQKYAVVPERRGIEPAEFGIFVDPAHCKGCGECVEVCAHLDHNALIMVDKQPPTDTDPGTVARFRRQMNFFYALPTTPPEYRNEKALADVMLGEHALGYVGGAGAMYDIGFQSLSRMVASGADIKVMVLDTQVYSNTGGQSSTASFGGQVTKLSAYGREVHGRPERRKELGRIMLAHNEVFVAQTTTAHLNHFYRAVMDANEYPGPAVIVVYTPCQPEHGIGDDAAAQQARLAVDSRAFPLFSYDPRPGETLAERLALPGNPARRAGGGHPPPRAPP